MSAGSPAASRHLAGVSLAALGFALRNWLAMCLALLVAFWLQLGSASSAATCVGILALPTRGQTFQKAVYRSGGTVLGVAASFAIAGVFNQERDLFILACAVWLGLCVFTAGLLDGSRAYGAVLSGYTVAIVAVAQIDSPQDTFSAGVNRGAAEVIGILAVAFISDLFRAPDAFPATLGKVEDVARGTRKAADAALRAGHCDPAKLASLLGALTALHPDITTLAAESVLGSVRAAAAARAVVAMIRQLSAVRAVTTLGAVGVFPPAQAAALAEAIAGGADADDADSGDANLGDTNAGRTDVGDAESAASVRRQAEAALADPDADADALAVACCSLVLLDEAAAARAAVADLHAGRGPARGPALPLYRSRYAAWRNGLRAAATMIGGAALLSITGWPYTAAALLQLAALVGISATNPDPKSFSLNAMIAMPIVVLAAGVTEFLMLDGADAFPALALAILPTVMVASLLMASGKPRLLGIGFIVMVYFPVLLSPANPQDYSPQDFLYSSLMSITAVLLLAMFLSTVLRTNDAMRRRWIMCSARADLRRALATSARERSIQGMAVRNADRLGQLGALEPEASDDGAADLAEAMHMADLSLAARRVRLALRLVAAEGGAVFPGAAVALAATDPAGLRDAAGRMSGGHQASERRAAAELLFAAALVEAHRTKRADGMSRAA